MVFSLVYSSTTDHDWSQDELVGLLEWSRSWNLANEVTGLLLYRDCAFMQFLEGHETTVRDLFGRIRVDRRHQDVDLMWTNDAEARRFADWTMAFRELGERPVEEPGYNDVLNDDADDADDADGVGGDPSDWPGRADGAVLSDFLSMFRA